LLLQAAPTAKQAQTPASHWSVQHCEFAVHCCPPNPHTQNGDPIVTGGQLPRQQSESSTHFCPGGTQAHASTFRSQYPVQQATPSRHGPEPFDRQAQVPPEH